MKKKYLGNKKHHKGIRYTVTKPPSFIFKVDEPKMTYTDDLVISYDYIVDPDFLNLDKKSSEETSAFRTSVDESKIVKQNTNNGSRTIFEYTYFMKVDTHHNGDKHTPISYKAVYEPKITPDTIKKLHKLKKFYKACPPLTPKYEGGFNPPQEPSSGSSEPEDR